MVVQEVVLSSSSNNINAQDNEEESLGEMHMNMKDSILMSLIKRTWLQFSTFNHLV